MKAPSQLAIRLAWLLLGSVLLSASVSEGLWDKRAKEPEPSPQKDTKQQNGHEVVKKIKNMFEEWRKKNPTDKDDDQPQKAIDSQSQQTNPKTTKEVVKDAVDRLKDGLHDVLKPEDGNPAMDVVKESQSPETKDVKIGSQKEEHEVDGGVHDPPGAEPEDSPDTDYHLKNPEDDNGQELEMSHPQKRPEKSDTDGTETGTRPGKPEMRDPPKKPEKSDTDGTEKGTRPGKPEMRDPPKKPEKSDPDGKGKGNPPHKPGAGKGGDGLKPLKKDDNRQESEMRDPQKKPGKGDGPDGKGKGNPPQKPGAGKGGDGLKPLKKDDNRQESEMRDPQKKPGKGDGPDGKGKGNQPQKLGTGKGGDGLKPLKKDDNRQESEMRDPQKKPGKGDGPDGKGKGNPPQKPGAGKGVDGLKPLKKDDNRQESEMRDPQKKPGKGDGPDGKGKGNQPQKLGTGKGGDGLKPLKKDDNRQESEMRDPQKKPGKGDGPDGKGKGNQPQKPGTGKGGDGLKSLKKDDTRQESEMRDPQKKPGKGDGPDGKGKGNQPQKLGTGKGGDGLKPLKKDDNRQESEMRDPQKKPGKGDGPDGKGKGNPSQKPGAGKGGDGLKPLKKDDNRQESEMRDPQKKPGKGDGPDGKGKGNQPQKPGTGKGGDGLKSLKKDDTRQESEMRDREKKPGKSDGPDGKGKGNQPQKPGAGKGGDGLKPLKKDDNRQESEMRDPQKKPGKGDGPDGKGKGTSQRKPGTGTNSASSDKKTVVPKPVKDGKGDGKRRRSGMSEKLRALGDLRKVKKEDIKKLAVDGVQILARDILKLPEKEIDDDTIEAVVKKSNSNKQRAALWSKIKNKAPSASSVRLAPWSRLKKIKDNVMSKMRPNPSTMTDSQKRNIGRRIISSNVVQFKNLAEEAKKKVSAELVGTGWAGFARKRDLKPIFEALGSPTVDKLKTLKFNRNKNYKGGFGKRVMKWVRNSPWWNCRGAHLKPVLRQLPAKMGAFMGKGCLEEADDSTVGEIVKTMGEESTATTRRQKNRMRRSSVRYMINRFTSKAKAMNKEKMKSIMQSPIMKLVSIRKLKDMPTGALCDQNFSNTQPPQRMLLYKKCKPTLGKLTGKTAKKYGALVSGLSTEDITDIDTTAEDVWDTVEVFCAEEKDQSPENEKALYKKIEPRFKENSFAALKDPKILKQSTCLLKLLDHQTLEELDLDTRETVCESIGKGQLTKLSITTLFQLKTSCLETQIPFTKLGGLLRSFKASDLENEEEQILESIEELSAQVVNPAARERIYTVACTNYKGEAGWTMDITVMVMCGKLMGEFGDLDAVDEDALDGVSDQITEECQEAKQREKEDLQVSRMAIECDTVENAQCGEAARQPLHAGCPRLINKIIGGKGKRRRRSARLRRETECSLTCGDIEQLDTEAIYLDEDYFRNLCADEFEDCASTLGSLPDFPPGHRQALLEAAIKHWGEPKTWTSEQVESAGAITLAMSPAQLELLPVSDPDTIHSIGQHHEWNTQAEKLAALFENWLRTSKGNNASAVTLTELQSMGHVACGASTDVIAQIDPEAFLDAVYDISQLDTCNVLQLREWAKKAIESMGPVTQWTRADVAMVGSIIGGLSEADTQLLTAEQIQAIPAPAISSIPITCLSKFTEQQFGQFLVLQTLYMTREQRDSLDADKLAIVNNKRAEIAAVVMDPNHDGAGTFVCASVWVLLTGLLAYFLQI